jgi:hypothetical protein
MCRTQRRQDLRVGQALLPAIGVGGEEIRRELVRGDSVAFV